MGRVMKDDLVEIIKKLLSTSQDLLDIRRGEDRIVDAESEVRETLALLKARRETLRLERRRDKS